jgi:hypothetical protein
MDQTILQQLIMDWMMPSILSAVAAFLLGIVWYHPKVLGAKWLEARGKTEDDLHKSSTPFILSFPLWFLTALFFTFILIYMNITGPAEIFLMACLLWVAFAMPPVVMASLYTGYPFGAVAIDASYQLGGYYALALTHILLNNLLS